MNTPRPHTSYSLEDIGRYLQGKLSPAEMHELEKAAVQDPFLSDAIDGYSSVSLPLVKTDLQSIQTKLSPGGARVAAAAVKTVAWWKTAAAAVLLTGSAATTWVWLSKAPAPRPVAAVAKTLPEPARSAPLDSPKRAYITASSRPRAVTAAKPLTVVSPTAIPPDSLVYDRRGINILAANTNLVRYVTDTVHVSASNKMPDTSTLIGINAKTLSKDSALARSATATKNLVRVSNLVTVGNLTTVGYDTPIPNATVQFASKTDTPLLHVQSSVLQKLPTSANIIARTIPNTTREGILYDLVTERREGILEPETGWQRFNDYFKSSVSTERIASPGKDTTLLILFTTNANGQVTQAFVQPQGYAYPPSHTPTLRKRAEEAFVKGPRWKYHGNYRAARLAVYVLL